MQSMTKSANQTFHPNCTHFSASYMVFGMDTDSISPEANNLLRLIYAIKKPCTDCLRQVLEKNVPPNFTDIKQAVVSKQNQLQTILTKKQFSSLFPQNQLCKYFSVYICDMSLLYILFRNVSSVQPPTTGWDQPVNNQPRDCSIGANVERLRVLRNDILHEERSEISDSDFNNYWIDMRASLADIDTHLGKPTYQQILDNLRTVDLDTRFVQKEIAKIRLRKALQRIQEGQDKHTVILEDVQNKGDELKRIVKEIQHTVCGSTGGQCEVRNDKVIDTQEVTRSKSIQGLSLENLQITDKGNQQRNKEEASNTDSTNIRNQHQNEADNKAVPKDAFDSDRSRENEISIAEGPDGVICLTKQYVYIKSNLLKRNADAIADCLLEDGLITKDEHETIAHLERKPCVDHLLKKIILGDADQLKTFFRALKSVNLEVARKLAATEVTDQDRSRFNQLEERALQATSASARQDSGSNLDDSDIRFFQYRLSASWEVVDSINDAMLARFNFSVRDHSNVLECKILDAKIQKLCETMNLCDMDVENELNTLLKANLYNKWIEYRKNNGKHERSQYLRWLNAPVALVSYVFRPLGFKQAKTGSIILKFAVGDGFDIASLTRESVQENMTDLLWKGYLETQINIMNPVHVTVFIVSPSKNGDDEIHFYLDFDTTEDRTSGEDYEHEIAVDERMFLLEKLDLTDLIEWITNQTDVEKTTKQMLEDKLSRSDMSRKEEINVLLDRIYELDNGRELIERFCKENDSYVYNKLFLTIDHDFTEKHESREQRPLQYERGGGLQRLYSFWMNINTEHEGMTKSQKAEVLQRASLDERPSKEPQYLEVSSPDILRKYELQSTLVHDRQKSYDDLLKQTAPGILHKYEIKSALVYERQKSDDELLEPTVRKFGSTTLVIQVGKLEEIWSDAMIIVGERQSIEHRSKLPKEHRLKLPIAIFEKFGPQIQREFQEKYPDGLSEGDIAVLSGFNLPVWKILYCSSSVGDSEQLIQECLIKAAKLKMKSVLFLAQKECLSRNIFEFLPDLQMVIQWYSLPSIYTIYFHINQDTFEWRTMKKIAEDQMLKAEREWPFSSVYSEVDVNTDVTKPYAKFEPKVFKVGHTTVIIQVGKLEKIQSDAVVIFDVSKGQWPKCDLPSEILEKAGPMIKTEFEEKFPAGLEYAEVAVLNGYNLPFRKILYAVLPRWRVAWLAQVIEKFVTECLQLASKEGIQSIAFMIPNLVYHVAEKFASVLHYSSVDISVHDKPSLSFPTLNIVIKDDCTGGSTLKKVFEDEWDQSILVFKEGHITVVIQDILLKEISSEALIILEEFVYITDTLEKIEPSSTKEFINKYSSGLRNEEVIILDGYNNPFRKIYCIHYIPGLKVIDTLLECFHMAQKEKMNSIIVLMPANRFNISFFSGAPQHTAKEFALNLIISLRIFVLENPSSSITRLYINNQHFKKEISDAVSTVKVFKERHVTVVIDGMPDSDNNQDYEDYNIGHYWMLERYGARATFKEKGSIVICGVSDVEQSGSYFQKHQGLQRAFMRYGYFPDPLYRKDQIIWQLRKGLKSGEVSVTEFQIYNFDAMPVFFGTPKLDRQDMDMFFYECLQKADGRGVQSIIFLIPQLYNIQRDTTLLARTLICCVKRFAKNTPFSSIKRIYIRIDMSNPWLQETKQVFEEEWANKSGAHTLSEDEAEDLSLKVDEKQEQKKDGGKEGSPSVDIYLKKTVMSSKLPEKSKDGSKYFPEEEVN